MNFSMGPIDPAGYSAEVHEGEVRMAGVMLPRHHLPCVGWGARDARVTDVAHVAHVGWAIRCMDQDEKVLGDHSLLNFDPYM